MTITCDYCGRQLQSTEIVGSGRPDRVDPRTILRLEKALQLLTTRTR